MFCNPDIADTLRYLLMGTTELGEEDLVEVRKHWYLYGFVWIQNIGLHVATRFQMLTGHRPKKEKKLLFFFSRT